MDKEKYTAPEMEIIRFEYDDIITTSTDEDATPPLQPPECNE